MAGNTTTKKEYGHVKSPVPRARPSKNVNYPNHGGSYTGQMRGNAQADKFGDTMNDVSGGISGISGTHDDIGEKSGFITDGYLDKGNTPYGESAKFNFLPPGMDISNQEICEIHDMPMRKLTSESYPGDGWMPAPRDLPE